MNFYSYIHAIPGGDPFYVGKGSMYRYLPKTGSRSDEYKAVSANGVEIAVIPCSSEAIAFDLEHGLIKCFRRMGIKLLNKAAGGRGSRSGAWSRLFDGKSVPELAHHANISYDTMHQRLTTGWSIDDAVSTSISKHNNRKYKFYDYEGVRDTVLGHCIRHGKKYTRVAKRLSAYGYSFEDAMEKEPRS